MPVASPAPESAIIMIPSSGPATPNGKLTGTIHERAKNSLTLLTHREIASDAVVRVHSRDQVSLGIVLTCTPQTEDMWSVYVAVSRTLLIL